MFFKEKSVIAFLWTIFDLRFMKINEVDLTSVIHFLFALTDATETEQWTLPWNV